MAQITYSDKVAINTNSGVADINKVNASDMNEIKSVVNGNYNEVGNITNLNTTDKTSVVNAINELTPVVLFTSADDSWHSYANLSDSVANYSYIRIFYSYLSTNANSFGNSSVDLYNPNNKLFLMQETVVNNGYIYFCSATWKASGNTLTKQVEERWRIGTSGNATRTTDPNVLQINKVIGYK